MKLHYLGLLAAVFAGNAYAIDNGQFANSPNKLWFESLEIPNAARQRMGIAYKSCCDRGDVVRTKFRVGIAGDDVWEYLDANANWKVIPTDIILDQPSMDTEPRLFRRIATGEPLCFVKPNGGI